jgi:hypothetical protein
MVAGSDRVVQVGDELAEAVTQWTTRAVESGAAVGKEARRAERVVRRRAGEAVRALRGQPAALPWVPLAVAAAIGFAIGVAVGGRARHRDGPDQWQASTGPDAAPGPAPTQQAPEQNGTEGQEDELAGGE